VGINYSSVMKPSSGALNGCVNDAMMIAYLLKKNFGFTDRDISLLADEKPAAPTVAVAGPPTRQNIITGMRHLVSGVGPGDSLFFHFSGHGAQQRDTDGDEDDGLDETILPLDYKSKGVIVDDEIYEILVRTLPAGVRLTAVMDCCHSGTGMDLAYTHHVEDGTGRGQTMRVVPGEASTRGVESNDRFIPILLVAGTIMAGHAASSSSNKKYKKKKAVRKKPDPVADVFCFSGCADNQTSADTNALAGNATTGAMTYSFIEAIEKGGHDWHSFTYRSFLIAIRKKMKEKRFKQTPQLSSGRPLNLDTPFRI